MDGKLANSGDLMIGIQLARLDDVDLGASPNEEFKADQSQTATTPLTRMASSLIAVISFVFSH